MDDKLMKLKEFTQLLTAGTKLHICIHDLSGMLSEAIYSMDGKNTIHFSSVCTYAKSTPKGLELCLKCKLLANNKAAGTMSPFCGLCPMGVTEYVYPVVIDMKLVCIVYVGNICSDPVETRRCIERAARITGIDRAGIDDALNSMEQGRDSEFYRNVAEAVRSYIILLYSYYNIKFGERKHWAVNAIANYADTFYNKDISISVLARLYNINEKYAGRLFKSQMNMSFNRYLNIRRVETAKRLLSESRMSVIEIAMECGYNNITYFNRVFKELTGMTPGEYRTI